jgi:cystathionine beta-lyase family protein involved in aluminum resistance
MAMVAKVEGVKELLRAFKAEKKRVKAMNRGLVKAGTFLLGKSMELVPVHTGVLRNSGSIIKEGRGGAFAVLVGYYTDYAVYVHENLDALHGADFNAAYADQIESGADPLYYFNRGERQQAMYLEQPFREELKTIKKIIAIETKRG